MGLHSVGHERDLQTKDQAECFDDAKGSHASQSFIQDKEIKDIQDSLQNLRKGILNRKGIPIEVAKGLAKNFKLKSLFQQIYSLVIDYQRM